MEIDDSLILLGLSGSEMLKAAKDKGLRYASEVFADRAYEDDGSLTPRALEGSVITDEDEAIKRHSRKGNSPDPQLRSPIYVKWRRM